MSDRSRHALLLVQLGTPRSPDPSDVRRYLHEFLSDPLVIDIPTPLRLALLHLVILRRRPKIAAAAYRRIWTDRGSPLLFHSQDLACALQRQLGVPVELAMRYGTPSMRQALDRLARHRPVVWGVLPLFPQYAAATIGSVWTRLENELRQVDLPPPIRLPPFYADAGFVHAAATLANRARLDLCADHVLFSFHGLPVRQLRRATGGSRCEQGSCCNSIDETNRDCYRAQCFATAKALGDAMKLTPEDYEVAFQSRFGRAEWTTPATADRIEHLARSGRRRLLVVSPSFVADCLETLEELAIGERERFRAAGGEELIVAPCVNSSPDFVAAIAAMFRRHVGANPGQENASRDGGQA